MNNSQARSSELAWCCDGLNFLTSDVVPREIDTSETGGAWQFSKQLVARAKPELRHRLILGLACLTAVVSIPLSPEGAFGTSGITLETAL